MIHEVRCVAIEALQGGAGIRRESAGDEGLSRPLGAPFRGADAVTVAVLPQVAA